MKWEGKRVQVASQLSQVGVGRWGEGGWGEGGGESANKGLAAAFCWPLRPRTGFMGRRREGKSRRGFAGWGPNTLSGLLHCTRGDPPAPGRDYSERCTVSSHPEQSKQCADQPVASDSALSSSLKPNSGLAPLHSLWLLSKASQVEKQLEVEVLCSVCHTFNFLATSIWECRTGTRSNVPGPSNIHPTMAVSFFRNGWSKFWRFKQHVYHLIKMHLPNLTDDTFQKWLRF